MFSKARGYVTLNALARSLRTDPRTAEALCRNHGVDVVPIEGTAFIADADVPIVRAHHAAWIRRPTGKLRRLQPRRSYAPWRSRAGDDSAGLARTARCNAAIDAWTSRRKARRTPPFGGCPQPDSDEPIAPIGPADTPVPDHAVHP
jgi:hypothetical protein